MLSAQLPWLVAPSSLYASVQSEQVYAVGRMFICAGFHQAGCRLSTMPYWSGHSRPHTYTLFVLFLQHGTLEGLLDMLFSTCLWPQVNDSLDVFFNHRSELSKDCSFSQMLLDFGHDLHQWICSLFHEVICSFLPCLFVFVQACFVCLFLCNNVISIFPKIKKWLNKGKAFHDCQLNLKD